MFVVLEVWTITRLVFGTRVCSCWKGWWMPLRQTKGLRIPWVAWWENVPLLGVHLAMVAQSIWGLE